MRLHIAFVLLCFTMVCGCSFGGETLPLDEIPTISDMSGQYTVKAGDSLMVSVWGEPRLSSEVLVREDGRFSMALVGDVVAEGKSLPGLAKDIEIKLVEYVSAPSVNISVQQSAPIRYYLSGSFVKPGEYFSSERITFLQAIATGGGFAPFAKKDNMILIRKSDGGELRYRLNYEKVIAGEEPNPVIFPGDVLAVQ